MVAKLASSRSEGEREKATLLVVDDDEEMRSMLRDSLGVMGHRAVLASSGEQALMQLGSEAIDVMITDLRMGGMSGLELARRAHERREDVPVIVLTAFGDFSAAAEAVRVGAYDFLSKPLKLDALRIAVARALEHRKLLLKIRALEQHDPSSPSFAGLVGTSAPMKEIAALVARIADSDSSVLITGESGTGKEVVSRALHDAGPRRGRPFIAINCAALPEALLESELFGHEKGAFTDARTARAGLFVDADGGTLLLDEIGELPLQLQAKLLRALQERVVRPIGGRKEVPFDVRLIAATNRDLEAAIEAGTFRSDLYFRIDVVEIPIPPLRSRGNDILLLAQHFLVRFAERAKKPVRGLGPEVAERLLGYGWPGNVRELQNAMERATALSSGDTLSVDDLPAKLREKRPEPLHHELTDWLTLEAMEKRYILQVLEACGGSRTQAARTLGLDRSTLWRKLERYGVAVDPTKKP